MAAMCCTSRPKRRRAGPLALKTGDWVTLDVAGRKLDMEVDDTELQKRRAALVITPTPIHSPWGVIWSDPKSGCIRRASARI